MSEKLRPLWIFLGAGVAPFVIMGLYLVVAGRGRDSDGIFLVISLVAGLIALGYVDVSWGWKAFILLAYIPVMGGALMFFCFGLVCGLYNSCL